MTVDGTDAGLQALVSCFSETREEGIERGVELVPQPFPDLSRLAATDVVVEVRSASVAYIDLLMLAGQYHHRPALPYTPGLEYAGVVRWVGADVPPDRLAPGDRVMSDFLRTGPRSDGPRQRDGGWASHAVAPVDGLVRTPDDLSFDAACNLLLNYETAHFAFVTRARLQRGESVLVTGATGAAGLAAVQTARILGAKTVIATGRSAARLHDALRLGADHAIDLLALPKGGHALRDTVKALTDGQGADVLFDTVGGSGLLETVRAMAFGGRVVIVGWAGNTQVAAGGGRGGSLNPDTIPTNLIQLKGLSVLGSPMVIASQRDPAARAQRHARIFEWMRRGLLTPVVSRNFLLSELTAAMRARLDGGVIGGCVVHPGGHSAPGM